MAEYGGKLDQYVTAFILLYVEYGQDSWNWART